MSNILFGINKHVHRHKQYKYIHMKTHEEYIKYLHNNMKKNKHKIK